MNEQQAHWTIVVVMLIGGLFGLYMALMTSYFMDALPGAISPLTLISQISPYYLGALVALQFCWFVRWQSLGNFY
jgi:hypothetical protein